MPKLDRIYWVCIALLCFIRGALIIPNVDDGIYFYQIYNTVGWRNPFYNDYYGQYFHFMKPLTVLYALAYSLVGNTSFRLIALLQSAELFACVAVLYACVRRYASETASRAGALIFLYFLFVQAYLSPTRPETTVLLCSLVVFHLCERFSDTHNPGCLCLAAAVVLLIALPMHTNGSIPFIYLALFCAAQRRRLSRGPLLKLVLCSLPCALAGAALLVYPQVSSFAQSLALFSYDGSRFSMIRGEYARMRQFAGSSYNLPLMLLLVSCAAALLLSGGRQSTIAGLNAYRTLLLFLLAVVLGLGVLPSATWEVYAVYYLFPLTAGSALAFDRCLRGACRYRLDRALLAAVGIITLRYGYAAMPTLYLVLYALPFFAAAVLPGRVARLRTLAVIIVPMFAYGMVEMGSSKGIYDRANHVIREAAEPVLAHPLFNFSGRNVVQVGSYQISGARGDYRFALQSAARTKADLIAGHPLVKRVAAAGSAPYQSEWVFRRTIGMRFKLIANDQWRVPALIESQVKPLGYAVIKEIPLSHPRLDRYADPSTRALRCWEYRWAGLTP